ncbi:hypothetical protein SUGI_1483330 [Cryptomeria japonica]|uniref:DUF4283 domain-containing protein n=1 Tax=Cryptomeria japonica TaxID=3369 RepID=A0AAD3NSJ1_CRYJA|nr:hypothetical protein SUGI_1483330 [Cryptomeria japonica]
MAFKVVRWIALCFFLASILFVNANTFGLRIVTKQASPWNLPSPAPASKYRSKIYNIKKKIAEGISLQKRLPFNGECKKAVCEIDLTSDTEEDRSLWADLVVTGRVVGPKLTNNAIKEWIAKRWGTNLVVKFIPRGFFVVVFAENSERNRILCQENWFLGDHTQPWSPNFDPLPLAVYDKHVWIRLYNLPIEYWGDISKEKIGRSLGTLLEDDEGIVEKDLYIYAWLKIAAVKELPSYITLITSRESGYNRLFVRRARRRFSQKVKSKQFWVEKNKPLQNFLCLPSILGSGKEVIGTISGNCTDSRKEVLTVPNFVEQLTREVKTKVEIAEASSSLSSKKEYDMG